MHGVQGSAWGQAGSNSSSHLQGFLTWVVVASCAQMVGVRLLLSAVFVLDAAK